MLLVDANVLLHGVNESAREHGVARRWLVETLGGTEAVGFAWIRTAGFCPPLMLTRPTPGTCEIFGASRVSAESST